MYMLSDRDSDIPALYIDTETAWCPRHEIWDLLIKKYAPHASYLYYAEEPGYGIYETNDIFRIHFDFDYVVDSYYDSASDEHILCLKDFFPEGIHFWKEDDLNTVLSDILQEDGTTDELIALLNIMRDNWESDSTVSIHEVERLDHPVCDMSYATEDTKNAG